jgi:ADP-ribose pyrophosphatase YjhB (NUDIX family)
MRAVGIIIKDGRILLMRRVKNSEKYFVFPGGSIEEDESPEKALERELKEELNLDIKNYEKVFEIENRDVKEAYYLIMEFSGALQLGGPEKERMNEQNQYYSEWLELMKAAELKNLFPREAVDKLRRLPQTHPNVDYYKSLPKKRMAAGVLIFNGKEELSLVCAWRRCG